MPGELIWVIATLVIVGIVLWGLTQLPIDPAIAKYIRVIVIVIVAIWVVYVLVGMIGSGPHTGVYLRR
jgi:hypothetical protein